MVLAVRTGSVSWMPTVCAGVEVFGVERDGAGEICDAGAESVLERPRRRGMKKGRKRRASLGRIPRSYTQGRRPDGHRLPARRPESGG